MTQQSQHPEFVYWFRQSSPYIQAFRHKTFVIAIEGEALQSEQFHNIAQDITLLTNLGIRVVLVHGARPQIVEQLQARGAQLRYENGLRVTDDLALECAKSCVGLLRLEIEASFSRASASGMTSGLSLKISSGNWITAKPLGIRDGIDYCHTGEIRKVDKATIERHLDAGDIALLSPLGYSSTGEIFNLTANEVATATAIALQADKLIFLTGSEHTSKLPTGQREFTTKEIAQLMPSPNLGPEEHPYLGCALQACNAGVKRTHLIDSKIDGALLQELFTRDGVGVLVSALAYEDIRQATIEDVGGILELIRPMEQSGILVRRSREQLELEIDHFTVIVRDGTIIACAALYPFENEEIGELACLAVHQEYQRGGRGDVLLKALERQGKAKGMKQIFVLTTQTAHWFLERGYEGAEVSVLPIAKQEMYNLQRKSKVFIKQM